ncbi:Breast cancer susceptibility 1-like protein [Thalictrum thalictroides]|uniref:Breast cancer susceptibility 1-like protein n=1 Tax=Thalictrum thalictroides TaxID=46969 RepID=A0A7J6UUU2_THATH|nr:Breast cancer susceptibility 1-like protein [Thalictrum thalictroides]
MVDSAHLEKMGRELKCPICLSLLNSAVSLTCNHVFCALCLTKSMKSDSHCPVCKVPYRRREIRPAPHMDNLVSIYRTMEVASGVSIHVTQNAPTKIPDGKKQLQVSGSDTGDSSRGNSKNKRILKKKGSKKLVKTLDETSDPQLSIKPSFPAKKRVHVPQCLQSETPTRIEKYEEHLGNKEEKGPKDGSNVLKEKPSFTEGGQPVFSPFFWLREIDDNDEVERLSSQSMEIDHASDTSPQKFPSFSDIKGSDNESPVKMTENEKGDTQFKLAAVFDSEMFEWTQRPCSPELCSTPVKNNNELDRVQENNEGDSDFLTAQHESENTEQGNGSTEMETLSSQKAKTKRAPNGRTRSNKSGKSKRKQDDLSVDESLEDIETLWQENNHFTKDFIPYRRNNVRKNKKAMFGTQDLNEATEEAFRFEAEVQNQIEEDKGKSIDLYRKTTGSNKKLKNATCKTMEKNRNSQKNLHNSEKENNDPSLFKGIKEVSINQDQRNDNAEDESLVVSCQKDNGRTYLGDKTQQKSAKADFHDQQKGGENLRKRKILRLSNDDSAFSLLAGKVVKGCSKAVAKKAQTITVDQKASESMATKKVQPTNKVLSVAKDRSLRKCESVRGQFCCAFCQSCKDTEVSGEMMHYSNGKPVAPDYNGGTGIIHAHRNCTEWAPNVYFENEIAINLEPELTRSRRIKCSCCGIKGAALGCYEKSCRKSFHVPCAKLVPQCRWDTENFVMLCPLHPLSKLPKELSGSDSQEKRQKRCALKRESQHGKAEVMAHHGASTNPLWKVPSHKWVLCCSGLTNAEKEFVSAFTKMTGVSLSKTYGPNVTHIIASTDENGACRRTLKFLMAILEGRWILKIDWIKACMQAMEPVAEEGYQISVDVHGIRDGPQLGRLRVMNKQPKLFEGCNFYFMGEFQPSYKGYLQDMVVAAGGNVLHRKPISGAMCALPSETTTYIIYNAESEESGFAKKLLCSCRRDEAEALASSNGAKVAAHSWVLDSIAACNLQTL